MPPVAIIPDPSGELDGSAAALLDNDVVGVTRSAPEDITKTLAARSTSSTTTSSTSGGGQGSINPNNINMQAMLALFAILGASFVIATIWFFFWAKNGGFVWRKGDWDDYKSTVLRRKGPDGKTLSNATKSTKLGGGSVRGYSDDGGTVTDMTETATTVTDEKAPRRKKNFRETAKEKLMRKRKEEKWEGEADDDVRAYRREKPARVGGLNAEADGTYYGTEYTPSSPPTASGYTESEVYEKPRHQRYSEDHHRRDTRNVSGFSFTAGSEDIISQAAPEEHLMRDPTQTRRETRRQQRQQQQQQHSEGRRSRHTSPRKRDAPRSSMPGGYTEPLDFSSRGTNSEYQYSTVDTEDDMGTKSYHHPIPGLTKGYRRDRDGGGRRRRDSLSDSD